METVEAEVMEDGIVDKMTGGMPDTVFKCVIDYIQDSRDRDAVSLVCRRWYEIDASARKHVTIALCYSSTPQQLRRRFQHLESLKLKGKPRAAMFNLIPEDWGGYVTPWVEEIARSFTCLKALHFRRMIVRDSDLELLSRSRGRFLRALKLDKCSGFSTDGLLHIGRSCRNLKTLFLEQSPIVERDGEWLHELALNNTVLETLNFYMTDLVKVSFQDLEVIARNCRFLVSVKISGCKLVDLVGFFRVADALEEFGGGCFSEPSERYSSMRFPRRLCCLGLTFLGRNEMSIVFPCAASLRRLDLLYALLDRDDHCRLLRRCPNLEVLETRNVIGDRGLKVLARCCKRMRRLRIERGAVEPMAGGLVSHLGLIALAQGCLELEYFSAYVSGITNASLECFGTHSENLCDFRLFLINRRRRFANLPLDNGVRALLQGCHRLRRFALYLRPGWLTNEGLSYIGRYSPNVRRMLLGCVGDSDDGLLEFSRGCPSLQKLEMRACCFSEHALATAVLQLPSLRFLWVEARRSFPTTPRNFLASARPFWNIELIPPTLVFVEGRLEESRGYDILAYYSLAGQRTDFPVTVVPLDGAAGLNA